MGSHCTVLSEDASLLWRYVNKRGLAGRYLGRGRTFQAKGRVNAKVVREPYLACLRSREEAGEPGAGWLRWENGWQRGNGGSWLLCRAVGLQGSFWEGNGKQSEGFE